MAKHYTIGGSTCGRTIQCPAWVERSKKYPKRKSGEAADIGNLLHDAMEDYYTKDTPFGDMVGKLKFKDQILTKDQVTEMLIPALSMTEQTLDKYDIEDYLCEPFVEIEPGVIGGSIDMIGVSADGETALILDYKFGRGVVPVEENPQLLFYALASSIDPKTRALLCQTEKLVLCIIQPHVSHQPLIWESPIDALPEFHEKLKDAINNPTRAAIGKYCAFCPAAPGCPERKAQAHSALLLSPSTAKELAESLQLASEVEAWAKQVKDQAQSIAIDGGAIPGYKLVIARNTRVWGKDSTPRVEFLLGDAAYTKTLLTPAKAEKVPGVDKKELKKLIESKPGNPALVPESDNRSAIAPTNSPENLQNFIASAKK